MHELDTVKALAISIVLEILLSVGNTVFKSEVVTLNSTHCILRQAVARC
jgi:hypothetical protein